MTGLRRYLLEGYVYHVSSSTDERRPIFASHDAAKTLLDAIQFQRKERALVLAYAVMPDHFHVLLQPREPWSLSKVIGSIKGYTSRILNESKGVRGRLWQPSFYDRVMRSEPQFCACIDYIHANPVVAGLSQEPEHYPFSSACPGRETDIDAFINGSRCSSPRLESLGYT